MSAALHLIAALLIVLALANTYFVWHGTLLYLAVRPRSPVLLALLGVKVVVWVAGLFVARIAVGVVFNLPPLEYNGLALGLVLLLLFLTPAFIHLQMIRFIEADDGS